MPDTFRKGLDESVLYYRLENVRRENNQCCGKLERTVRRRSSRQPWYNEEVLARIRQLKRSQVKILAGATSAVRACLEVCRRVAAVTARRHHTPWKDIQVGHTISYGGEAR